MKNKPGRRGLLTAAIFLYASLLFSQTFTEQTGITLPGISNGNAVWGDADNDGDIDILIAGLDVNGQVTVKLYRNNGSFVYTDNGTFSPAIPAAWTQYDVDGGWSDFDKDGFLDILLNIPKTDGGNAIYIYRHEADHSYLLKATIDYYTWQGNSADIGDYDNDGDKDILIITNNSSRLFQNQGNFIFNEQTSINLEGLTESSGRFADYDIDGDLDIVIMGFPGASYSGTSIVYENNGNNTFTLQNEIYLEGTFDGSSEWGDYNNDGFPDILITGKYGNTKIYRNDGLNNFFIQNVGTIPGVTESDGKWGDLDNDGDLDIVISGKNNNTNITKAFINNGNNTFQELAGFSLPGLYRSSVDLFDYNNDNKLDILLSGDNGTTKICKVYLNGSGVANPLPSAPTGLTATPGSNNEYILQWNPVTGDNTPAGSITYNIVVRTSAGTENIVSPHSAIPGGLHRVSGMGNGQTGTSFIIKNIPSNTTYYWRVQAIDNSFKGGPFSSESSFTYSATIQASDLTVPVKDGVSATLSWSRGNGAKCAVFVKEGNTGTASPTNKVYTASATFKSGEQISSSGWYCVYDGTGSTVNVSGFTAMADYSFQVFEYNTSPSISYFSSSGNNNPMSFTTGSFSEVKTAVFTPVNLNGYIFPSSTHWVDTDNDNDLDLFLHGSQGGKLYRNNGGGSFTLMAGTFEPGHSAAFGDYDNDELIDLAITANPIRIYRNTGSNVFAEQPGSTIQGNGRYGSLAWGDYDNDGDLDLVKTGESDAEGKTSKVFRNNGDNTFTEVETITLTGMAYGSSEWKDYNKDGLLDLAISGYDNSSNVTSEVYKNLGNGKFEKLSGFQMTGISNGTMEWGDYDNDGDPDLLLTGSEVFTPVTKIYTNNGNNSFTELTSTPFPPLHNSSARWGDYDADGDLDILLTGYQGFYISPITRIYKNNGDNTFSHDLSAIFPSIASGSASWGDYDKDGRLDVIVSGQTVSTVISKLYRNNLIPVNNSPAAVTNLASAVNKSDVILTWKPVKTDNTPYKSMTYNLRVKTNGFTPYDVVSPHSSGTGYRRIATFGNIGQDTTFLLKKMPFGSYLWSIQAVDNGFSAGSFPSDLSFTVSPVQAGKLSARIKNENSLLLKWERGNGDRCVVFAKQTSTGSSIPVNNTGYIADPELGFGTQIGTSGWYCVYNGRADSVMVTGLVPSKQYSFHIIEYIGSFGSEQYFTVTADGNPGVFSTSLFTEQTGISLNPAWLNNVSWGDYDNDGFLDIVVPGFPSRIYRNNGNNTFEEKTTISLPNCYWGAAEWGDYDNDNDLDLIITGANSTSYPLVSPMTKIYRNNGVSSFTEQTSIILPQLLYSSAAWGDYDNDGDLDILINGASGSEPNYVPVSKIYDNNGAGSFIEQTQISLTGLFKGSAKFVDYDNDGDLDIIMTGSFENDQWSEGIMEIYKNNGNKTFSKQSYPELPGSGFSTTSWSDFDKDGDQDFIYSERGLMNLYRNNRENGFEHFMSFSMPFQGRCMGEWGDYNNDGYLDIILTNPGLDTRVIMNTRGVATPESLNLWFKRQDVNAIQNIGYSHISWADYDNDGDLDFLVSKDNSIATKIIRNNLKMNSGLFKINTAPEIPTELSYTNSPLGVILKWKRPTDTQTDSLALAYNVRIGLTKNNFNITPSHSSSTGYRRLTATGNAQLDTTYLLINMPAAKYYWSVQAADQAFMGSAWSPVDSFQVKNVLAFFSADTVCHGLNTTFTNQSVGFGETIQSYKWIFENGATSVVTNPTYTFATSGVKNVTLITYSSTTSDTLVKQVLVKAKPLLDFSASVACVGTETTLTNLSNVTGLNITSWSWDYGDGKGSAAMSPGTHGYLNPGDYEVILAASADNNCSESITKNVTVASYPVASISATTPLSFCSGDSVSLSVASYSNHTYRWISNGVDVSGGITNRITAKNTGNYTVEVINLIGNCKTTSSPANVTVVSAPAAPLITAPASTTICDKDSVLLYVSNTPGYSYQWKLNGGTVGPNSSQYYAKNSGTYSITVSNSNGCSVSSTNQVPVTVNSLPAVTNISLSGNDAKFCRGESITLSVPLNSAYVYNWRRGTTDLGLTSNSITISEKGDYSVVTSSQFNCRTTSDIVSIEVVDLPAEPVIDYGSYKRGDCLDESPLRLAVKDVVQEYTYKWYKNGTPVGNSSYIETRDEGKYYVESIYDICRSDTASLDIDLQTTLQKPEIIVKGSNVWYLSTSSKASLYKWYYNGTEITGAEGNTYVAGQNFGIYRVAISDGSGCYAYSDTVRIKGLGITGIEDTDPFKTLVVYPNPSSGVFNIEMNNNLIGKLTVRIFHQDGKKVFDREFEKNDEKFLQQIDIGKQRIGLYLISLYINGQISNTKFIVE